MSKLKLASTALLAAALGFVIQGCFAAQPPPECNVVTADPVVGVSNYLATLKKGTQSGDCSGAPSGDLSALEVGMMRFAPPGSTDHTVAVRSSYIVDVSNGHVYAADLDKTNNCSNAKAPGKCTYCIASGSGSTATLADGGAAATVDTDGGTIGIVYPAGDGGTRIDLKNVCKVTVEGAKMRDSTDPNGDRFNVFAKVPLYPSNGVCSLSAFDGGVENLDSVLVNGTLIPAPASLGTTLLATNWSNFEIIQNAKVPATFWTATLDMVEGTCATKYEVTAFWPEVDCTLYDAQGEPVLDANGNKQPNEELCDPVGPGPDAGPRYTPAVPAGQVFTGSGLSPYFKPKCNPDLLLCVPTVTAADLK